MMSVGNKHIHSGTWIVGCLGILAGILLILLDAALLLNVIFVIMGVFTLIANIPGIIIGISEFSARHGKFTLITSGISVIVGLLMIFHHSEILMILLGIYMIVLPLFEILTSKQKGKQLLADLPKLILGVILIIIGPAGAMNVLFDIVGALIIIASIVIALIPLLRTKKYSHKTGGRVFADTNGDGTIDTVFVDTTGDGKPDVGVNYKEKK